MALLSLSVLAACAPRDPAVGYTYECKPAPGNHKILARVHALESHDGGDAVLVSIADGPNPSGAPRIVFAAFDRKTFADACATRSTKAVLRPDPRFNDTRRAWLAALPEGRAGVHQAPVADVVADFRALPVPPFTAEPGETPAAALLGPGPNAATYFTEPQP